MSNAQTEEQAQLGGGSLRFTCLDDRLSQAVEVEGLTLLHLWPNANGLSRSAANLWLLVTCVIDPRVTQPP